LLVFWHTRIASRLVGQDGVQSRRGILLYQLALWLVTVEESLPEKPKFRDDLDRERKKQKILSLVLIAIVAVVVILFVISLVRGQL
jgi:hypothetical protein